MLAYSAKGKALTAFVLQYALRLLLMLHIYVCRTDNLFRQMDERQLTEEEHNIIQQRVGIL